MQQPNSNFIFDASNYLASERNKEKAMKKLREKGASKDQARDVVDQVYESNRRENRKTGFWKMILGGGLFLLFIIAFSMTGRLYFIAIPLALFSFSWGLANWLMASGYEIQTTNSN